MSAKAQQKKSQMGHEEEAPDFASGLPSNLAAERGIIGAVLLRNNDYFAICETLSPSDFTLDSNRIIFTEVAEMMNVGVNVDLITLSEALSKKKKLSEVGGVTYLSGLTDGCVYSTKGLKNWAQSVRDISRRRELIARLNRSVAMCLDTTENLEECIGAVEADVIHVMSEDKQNTAKLVKEFSSEVYSQLYLLRSRKTEVVGLSSGLRSLDDATTGLRDGEVVVIAGRPGHGKSSLALQCAIENAKKGVPTGFFSLEMRRDELLLRAASMETKINHLLMRDPRRLDEDEMNRIAESMKEMNEWPLYIDDTGGLHINQLLARARMLVAKGVKLIIIDYVQKVRHSEKDLRLGTNVVSDSIREFAKNTKVPVVILSQLKRPEGNPNARPTMYDLKESGNLEQDAHVVFLLYRPMDKLGQFTGEDEAIIGKQRNGPTGSVPIYYHGTLLTFEEREVNRTPKDVPAKPATVAAQRSFTEREDENS
jgi:replicative DNA helicase